MFTRGHRDHRLVVQVSQCMFSRLLYCYKVYVHGDCVWLPLHICNKWLYTWFLWASKIYNFHLILFPDYAVSNIEFNGPIIFCMALVLVKYLPIYDNIMSSIISKNSTIFAKWPIMPNVVFFWDVWCIFCLSYLRLWRFV